MRMSQSLFQMTSLRRERFGASRSYRIGQWQNVEPAIENDGFRGCKEFCGRGELDGIFQVAWISCYWCNVVSGSS